MLKKLPLIAVMSHTVLVAGIAVLVQSDIQAYGKLWWTLAVVDFPSFFLALVIESPICGWFENPYIGWVYISAAVFGLVGGIHWYMLAKIIQKQLGPDLSGHRQEEKATG